MSILSIGPRITRTCERLEARESLWIRILLCGAYLRTARVDRPTKTISIQRRVGWFFNSSRKIAMGDVKAITYDYRDLARPIGADIVGTAHDSSDCFTVGLLLRDGSTIDLFEFVGEGDFRNETHMPDWAFIHLYLFNLSESQERQSRAFVDHLTELLDVPTMPGKGW